METFKTSLRQMVMDVMMCSISSGILQVTIVNSTYILRWGTPGVSSGGIQ